MSAPEGVRISECALAILEICAARGRVDELAAYARSCGMELPGIGRVVNGAGRLILCVRPGRWLILTPPASASPDEAIAGWRPAGAALGAAVDLSAGCDAFLLQGTRTVDVLARGCRLDLDPQLFLQGHAAATIMAQVPVTLASLPAGMLLLTPASTSRHFAEWLSNAAQAYGLMPQSTISVADLCRSRMQ